MRWLYERFTKPGKRDIKVSRTLGTWEISVVGCGQTTGYTNAMWKDAFSRLADTPVKTILLLGLGAGGSIPLAHKQFGEAEIVAVEYDSAMIALAREFELYKPWNFPRVIEGDAALAVPSITETFDLIIMDLFDGPEPSPLTTNTEFLSHITSRLNPGGIFLINVYKHKEYLNTPAAHFANTRTWQFGGNTLGAFSNS